MDVAKSHAELLELISFRIGEQEFCLDIMAVREVRGWAAATPLPHSPPYVRGVINLRGAVLPILDLKARLGLGETVPGARSVIIVVHIEQRLVGLLVDEVSEVMEVEKASIQVTPSVGCSSVETFVRGIIPLEGRMISWIALGEILPEQGVEAA